eukprot:GHVP01034839.1.p1 GENE.GHVP01034839.1~~GHVP01034839.1.p1  ORF type:complete len:899 (+),score=185.52 GHVP01034839.1:3-2699(+)
MESDLKDLIFDPFGFAYEKEDDNDSQACSSKEPETEEEEEDTEVSETEDVDVNIDRPFAPLTRLFSSYLFYGTRKRKRFILPAEQGDLSCIQRKKSSSVPTKESFIQKALSSQARRKERRRGIYKRIFKQYHRRKTTCSICSNCNDLYFKKEMVQIDKTQSLPSILTTDWESKILWSEEDAEMALDNRPKTIQLYVDLPDDGSRRMSPQKQLEPLSQAHQSLISSINSLAVQSSVEGGDLYTGSPNQRIAQGLSRILQMPQSLQSKTVQNITNAISDHLKRKKTENEQRIKNTIQTDLQETLKSETEGVQKTIPTDVAVKSIRGGTTQTSLLSNRTSIAARITNIEFEEGGWVKDILWDECSPKKTPPEARLLLDMNDPNILIENIDAKEIEASFKEAARMVNEKQLEKEYTKPLVNKHNFSNDRYYITPDFCKPALLTQPIPQSVTFQHLPEARHLDPKLYKLGLTKKELANFHRPQHFLSGHKLKLTNIQKMSAGPSIILLEHSVKEPLLLTNIGMASVLGIYYRKRTSEDTYLPKGYCGKPVTLERKAPSPFSPLGELSEGEEALGLTNNLFSVPLYRHSLDKTDFLVSKTLAKDEEGYGLLPLSSVYSCGIVIPHRFIYRPGSKEYIGLIKDYLKDVIMKLHKESPNGMIDIDKINQRVSSFSPGITKTVLRDILDTEKKTTKKRLVSIRGSALTSNEGSAASSLTPENICLHECISAAAYREKLNLIFEKYAEDSTRVLLDPWTVSKNLTSLSSTTKRITTMSKIQAGTFGYPAIFNQTSKINQIIKNTILTNRAKTVLDFLWEGQKKWLCDGIAPKLDENEKERLRTIKRKRISIRRMIRNKNGGVVVVEEIVTDPLVAAIYLDEKESYYERHRKRGDILRINPTKNKRYKE